MPTDTERKIAIAKRTENCIISRKTASIKCNLAQSAAAATSPQPAPTAAAAAKETDRFVVLANLHRIKYEWWDTVEMFHVNSEKKGLQPHKTCETCHSWKSNKCHHTHQTMPIKCAIKFCFCRMCNFLGVYAIASEQQLFFYFQNAIGFEMIKLNRIGRWRWSIGIPRNSNCSHKLLLVYCSPNKNQVKAKVIKSLISLWLELEIENRHIQPCSDQDLGIIFSILKQKCIRNRSALQRDDHLNAKNAKVHSKWSNPYFQKLFILFLLFLLKQR